MDEIAEVAFLRTADHYHLLKEGISSEYVACGLLRGREYEIEDRDVAEARGKTPCGHCFDDADVEIDPDTDSEQPDAVADGGLRWEDVADVGGGR